jgi:hypothetical protein
MQFTEQQIIGISDALYQAMLINEGSRIYLVDSIDQWVIGI